MAKKKRKARSSIAPQKSSAVRLSQCMIVKNEERNIEKALSWGKGIVCEQIVVDTGSTDRTVELAERMGAKVLHFQWIDDFAAAKNTAIEEAKGNWIAFLDADEFFTVAEAKKILPILRQVMSSPDMRGKFAIACPMHQLNDDGKVMDVNMQARLFRNVPEVRYVGRIHEQLSVDAPEIIRTEDLCIMHTGYSESANTDTGKAMRNIKMLRRELELDPESLRMKMYLADSLVSYANELLLSEGTDSISDGGESVDAKPFVDEAEALYKEVALGDTSALDPEYKKTAYRYLLRKYSKSPGTDPVYDEICENARRENPEDSKIMCLYAAVLNKKGEYQKAFDVLRQCELRQESRSRNMPSLSVPELMNMCREFVTAAHGIGDAESIMKYTTVILSVEKDNLNILSIYIKLLLRELKTDENVREILSMTYDLSNPDDAAIVANAAKMCGAENLIRS